MNNSKLRRAGYAVIGLLFGLFTSLAAQAEPHYIRCATEKPSGAKLQQIETRLRAFDFLNRLTAQSAISIPVYFHVIQSSTGDNDATEDQMNAQLRVLNSAYGRGGISFTMGGIDVTVNDDWFYDISPGSLAESDMKSSLHVGGANVLNVYLAQLGNNLLGWAYFPWDYADAPDLDGVVILYSSLPGGDANGYNLGQTLTHEGGHWLGLYHTFEPGSGSDGCKGKGDFISDTPAEKVPHFSCRQSDSCPRISGRDPIHNYMDYTPDSCLNNFTRGQYRRISSMWNAYRSH